VVQAAGALASRLTFAPAVHQASCLP
jgi:hypothetical protein